MVVQVHARGGVHIPMPYKTVAHREVIDIINHILTRIGDEVRRQSSIGGYREGIGGVGRDHRTSASPIVEDKSIVRSGNNGGSG